MSKEIKRETILNKIEEIKKKKKEWGKAADAIIEILKELLQ